MLLLAAAVLALALPRVLAGESYAAYIGPVAMDTRLVLPTIVEEPRSVTKLIGETATFSVTVTGTPPFSFQWRCNGTNLADGNRISGARTSTLTITSVQSQDYGFYTAVVSIPHGSVTSSVASLTVLLPPQLLTQPQSQAVVLGTSANFSVTVAGLPPFSFQWRRTGTNLADGNRISGALTDSLTITNAQSQDAAIYSVVVGNAGGSVTSSVASLTVLVPPQLLIQPQNQTLFPGATANFSVSVTGTPPLSLQWRCNGTNLADGGRISGVITNSLTITSVQSQDVGFYSVVVSNPWGSVTSAPALLRVLSVERLTLSVSNQSPASFNFTNAAWVELTLTAPFPNPFIWYTLDGSPPSPSSTEYTGTFIVSNTVVVRALAINPLDFSTVEMAPAAINLWTVFHLFATATTGGMVSLAPPGGFYLSNTVVTLTALPEAGWEFLSWTGDASGTANPLDLVMHRDRIVTAQFGLIPRFTLAVRTVGSGTVSGNTQSNYERGTRVDLSAAPDPGWEFLSWSGDASGTSSNLSLVMDRNKSVTAQFGLIPRYTLAVTKVGSGAVSGNTQSNYMRGTTVNLSAEPAPGWEFVSWSGDASGTSSNLSLVMDRNKSVTAQFRQFLFTLTVTTVGGGAVTGNTQSNYMRGTTVNLSAAPSPGWEFLSWAGDASGTSSNLSLLMDTNKSVTVQFGLIPRFTLAVRTVGSGTVSGNTQSNYLRGTTVNLGAAPSPGWEFLSWSGDASGTSSNVSVVMDRDKSVTAQFGRNAFTLTVTTVGGGVVSGNTQSNYFRGTTVNLSAAPTAGWYFQNWSGDASGTSRNVGVVMDRDKSVAARFAPLTLLAMTAGGGTITANPASNYVQDSTVVLTAQPQSGWTFLNWMGDASGTNPQASVTMDGPKEVQAVFGTECKTTVAGQGAVVRDFGTGQVPFGAVVRLTAIPQPGYYLGLWGNAASSQVNPLDFIVTNATPTVGALFAALGANQATLTVRDQGAGGVAREPQLNAYTKGQAVRLTAQPFPGQAFLGWTGDASGTQNPLTVTLTTNKTITATFTHRLGLTIQPWPGPTQRRGFLFLLTGDEGNTCLVQTSPDLADWQPLTTLTISNTVVQFIDVGVTNHSPRFYRGVLP